MPMLLSIFPDIILDKYNLKALAIDSWVYIEIKKMYVWIETNRLTEKSTLGKFWLLSSSPHTGPVVT
jgi:hypothetical protein